MHRALSPVLLTVSFWAIEIPSLDLPITDELLYEAVVLCALACGFQSSS